LEVKLNRQLPLMKLQNHQKRILYGCIDVAGKLQLLSLFQFYVPHLL